MASAARQSRPLSSHEWIRERAVMKDRTAAAKGEGRGTNPYTRLKAADLHEAWLEGFEMQEAGVEATRDRGLFD